MDKSTISLKRLRMQGVWFGNLFALFASFLFAIIDGIAIQINGMKLGITESFSLDYPFLALTFGIGFALSILPASLGGATLALFINRDSDECLSQRKALFLGLGLGGLSGLAVCVLVGFLFFIVAWSRGHGALTPFLIRSAAVMVLASLAGGLTGLALAGYCKKKKRSEVIINA